MNRRLLFHYNNELAHLRQNAAEFAREFPKVAGRLAVDPEGVARLPAAPAASIAPLVLAPVPDRPSAAPTEASSAAPSPATSAPRIMPRLWWN